MLDTSDPYGAAADTIVNMDGVRRAIATGQPVIGPKIADGGHTRAETIPVFVPARVNGKLKYVLVASLRLFVISAIFRDQKLPTDWTGVVLNNHAVILGRSRSPEIYVGQPAPRDLTSAVAAQDDGITRSMTQEGWPMLAAFARSSLTGWTIVLGMPVASAESAAGRTLLMVIGTGAAVSLLALALAAFLGRQISRSVLGLLEPALAVASGAPITSARKSAIAEFNASPTS